VSSLSCKPRLLALLGSPRARSNTGVLLARILAGASAAGAHTDLVHLRGLEYASCRHCGGCDKTGRCVVQDDIQQLYPKLDAAQHLVLASPVHFSGVSGETKAMIDRAQCCWIAKYRLKRPLSQVTGVRRGLFVATCGGRDTRVFEWARHTVKAFFNSTGFQYWGELFEAATDRPPPVDKRVEALAKAEELGRKLVSE